MVPKYVLSFFATSIINVVILADIIKETDHVMGPFDICESDTFEPNCGNDEVVIVTAAKYGRMSIGSCITEIQMLGHVHCEVDVLDVVGNLCSGQRTCKVHGSHPLLMAAKTKSCPKDFSVYLAVSYQCAKTETGDRQSCRQSGHNPLTTTSGYISSRTATDSGFGTMACPWKLQTTSRLNFTLYRFGGDEACHKVATVTEGNEKHDVVSCGSDSGVKNFHNSRGNSVQLVFSDEVLSETVDIFLIHYEAINCEDPKVPRNVEFTRLSTSMAEVLCKDSGKLMKITCVADKWPDFIRQCKGENEAFGQSESSPYAFLIIILVGTLVGMVIGGILLWILIMCFRRCLRLCRKKRKLIPTEDLDYTSHFQKPAIWPEQNGTFRHNWIDFGTTSRELGTGREFITTNQEFGTASRGIRNGRNSVSRDPRASDCDYGHFGFGDSEGLAAVTCQNGSGTAGRQSRATEYQTSPTATGGDGAAYAISKALDNSLVTDGQNPDLEATSDYQPLSRDDTLCIRPSSSGGNEHKADV